MSELGREARALLANARGAHDAPADAKTRVRAGLAAAIVASSGAGAVRGAGGGARVAARAGARAGAGAGWMTAAKVAVVLAVIGSGAAWVARRGGSNVAHESVSAPVAATATVAVSAPVSAPTVAPAIEVAPDPVASAPSTPVASSPHRVDPDRSVAAEVAILHRVSDALRAGDAKSALAGVDEHARRFPNGTLAEERDMQRIVALCALGRRDDAARATARFSRAFPSSSYDARIHEACATALPAGDAP